MRQGMGLDKMLDHLRISWPETVEEKQAYNAKNYVQG